MGGDRGDSQYRAKQAAALAACKFFQAQRSLVHFQFESVLDVAAELIKAVVLPFAFEQMAEAGEAPFEAPPSPELVDAVLESVGSLTGKTFGSLRKHFLGLSQDKLSFFNGFTAMESIKCIINNQIAKDLLRGNRNPEEAAHLSACLKAASTYFKMVEILSGI